jgi:hypothetical protein
VTWRPVVVLLLVAPYLGEVLSTATSPLQLLVPWRLGLLVALYGCGALLCREVAVRFGFGLPGLALLGAAYGVYEEALVDRYWFDQGYAHSTGIGNYTEVWHTNLLLAAHLTAFHAAVSICSSVLLVSWLFPAERDRPWLHPLGLVVCAVALLAVPFLTYEQYTRPRPPQMLAAFGVGLLLVAAGLRAPRPAPATPQTTKDPNPPQSPNDLVKLDSPNLPCAPPTPNLSAALQDPNLSTAPDSPSLCPAPHNPSLPATPHGPNDTAAPRNLDTAAPHSSDDTAAPRSPDTAAPHGPDDTAAPRNPDTAAPHGPNDTAAPQDPREPIVRQNLQDTASRRPRPHLLAVVTFLGAAAQFVFTYTVRAIGLPWPLGLAVAVAPVFIGILAVRRLATTGPLERDGFWAVTGVLSFFIGHDILIGATGRYDLIAGGAIVALGLIWLHRRSPEVRQTASTDDPRSDRPTTVDQSEDRHES